MSRTPHWSIFWGKKSIEHLNEVKKQLKEHFTEGRNWKDVSLR